MQVEALKTPGAMLGILLNVHDWASVDMANKRGTANTMRGVAAGGMAATGSQDARRSSSSFVVGF